MKFISIVDDDARTRYVNIERLLYVEIKLEEIKDPYVVCKMNLFMNDYTSISLDIKDLPDKAIFICYNKGFIAGLRQSLEEFLKDKDCNIFDYKKESKKIIEYLISIESNKDWF